MCARVVVAGGGVAALETVAALRVLAGTRAEITLVAPTERFVDRSMSVAASFGSPAPAPPRLPELAARAHCALRRGTLAGVDPGRRQVQLDDGETLAYDALVVATGAVPRPAFPGAISFGGAADAGAVADALEAGGQLAFVSPTASGWPLPVYELALMSARAHPGTDIAVVTAEPSPLWIFGVEAGEAIRGLLVRQGVGLLSGVRVLAARDGQLILDGSEPITADRAVALPSLTGPAIAGLPCDDRGFVPVDAHGAVTGSEDVNAAGDVTAFPLKQGGLAAQQADAVAESIAARLGAPVTPKPFEPVLRGLLLTGDAALYLRTDGTHGTSHRVAHAAVSGDALWWPPVKVAARYLAAVLGPDVTPAAPVPLQDLTEQAVGGRPQREDPADLAFMLAREEADRGDYASALRSLDTAQALAGGELPLEWQRTRRLWLARAGDWPSA